MNKKGFVLSITSFVVSTAVFSFYLSEIIIDFFGLNESNFGAEIILGIYVVFIVVPHARWVMNYINMD